MVLRTGIECVPERGYRKSEGDEERDHPRCTGPVSAVRKWMSHHRGQLGKRPRKKGHGPKSAIERQQSRTSRAFGPERRRREAALGIPDVTVLTDSH